MAIQIGAKPDSGFDDPIGMLKDCHRRIERFLHILCAVAERAQQRALTEEETVAVESSLQYFRVGGKRHNEDEEQSLFPRLRRESSVASIEELGRLENDHHHASDLHNAIEAFYSTWIAHGSLVLHDEQRLRSSTAQLKHLYEEHIQVEEKTVFPRASEMLDSRIIAEMGREFHARRQ